MKITNSVVRNAMAANARSTDAYGSPLKSGGKAKKERTNKMTSTNRVVRNAMAANARSTDAYGSPLKKGDYVIYERGTNLKPQKVVDLADKNFEDWVLLEGGKRVNSEYVVLVGHNPGDVMDTNLHRLMKRYIRDDDFGGVVDVIREGPANNWIPSGVRNDLFKKAEALSKGGDKASSSAKNEMLALVDKLYFAEKGAW